MRRRDFIGVLGGTALWPLVGAAQQRKVPTIGVLVVGSPGSEQFWQLFQKAMRALGYVEGQSIRYEFRTAVLLVLDHRHMRTMRCSQKNKLVIRQLSY